MALLYRRRPPPPSVGRRTTNLKPKNADSFCCARCCQYLDETKLLTCDCGEDWKIYEWCWETDSTASNIILSNNNRDAQFHPVYSSGTAAVKGDTPFKQNFHYYWEIKMLNNLYGTDVMVGVGTPKVVLSDWKLRFCSMLGFDGESWGYSYHGRIQHSKLTRKYGSQFGLASIVGVHLDMCKGTLEYYVNRKPLGVAFAGLKNYELYPMVSSTAAQSAVRVSCSLSQKPTLEMICLQAIIKHPELYKQYQSIPGLGKMVEKKYFWLIPRASEKKEDATKTKLGTDAQGVFREEHPRPCKRLRNSIEPIANPFQYQILREDILRPIHGIHIIREHRLPLNLTLEHRSRNCEETGAGAEGEEAERN